VKRSWLIPVCLSALAVSAAGQDDAPATHPAAAAISTDERCAAWASHIEAPPAEPDAELARAIRRLNAVRMPELEEKAARAEPVAPLPPAAPAATSQPTSAPTSQPAAQVTLDKLSEHIGVGSAEAVELADALFLSGRYELALQLYERAAEVQTDPGPGAWLAFQTANCRMRMDPQAAVSSYLKLVEKYPDSPFAAVADVRRQLIEWRAKNDVDGLLEQVRQKDSH